MRIILASASPRRKELLEKLFETFEIIPAKGEEICTKELPDEVVKELSAQKALEIEQDAIEISDNREYLIIGADTVVALGTQILGKPKDQKEAAWMLHMLEGNVHQVYTGVTIIIRKESKRRCIQFAECSDVAFYPMTEKEIRDYIQTGEPMDKAGSYGIQGIGGRFVKRIGGDYNNVVGLPTARIYQILKDICPDFTGY